MDQKSTGMAQSKEYSAPEDKAKQEAREAAARLRSTGEEVKEEASRKVSDVMEDAKDEFHEVAQDARSYGSSLIQSQQEAIAERIHEYSEAARAAADKLKEEGRESVGRHVSDAAQQLEKTSRYLRDRDPSAIFADAQDFAEKRPEIVYGGMFLAGLAVARFMKASRRHSRPREGVYAQSTGDEESMRRGSAFPRPLPPYGAGSGSGQPPSPHAPDLGQSGLGEKTTPEAGQPPSVSAPATPGSNQAAGGKTSSPQSTKNPNQPKTDL